MPLRGDVRPRAHCPLCGRSTAVTFNARTGDAYLRTHNIKPGTKCLMSTRVVHPSDVYQPRRAQ